MNTEDKELLLKDLCARLPYGVIVHIRYTTGEPCYGKLTPKDIQWTLDGKIETIKPYLRPMSSMTEAEIKELAYKVLQQPDVDIIRQWVFNDASNSSIDVNPVMIVDWLIARHFDYRGLIPMGLALEAKEGMYK